MSSQFIFMSALSNMQFLIVVACVAVVFFVFSMIVFSSSKKKSDKRIEKLMAQISEEIKAETENVKEDVVEEIKAETEKDATQEEDNSSNNEQVKDIQEQEDYIDLEEDAVSVEAELVEQKNEDERIVFADESFSQNYSTIKDDAEKQALKEQIKALKNDVESLKFELKQKDPSRSVSPTGFNIELGDLERELYKAQEQYAYMGEKLLEITDENERLDIYLQRITLLEKIMKLGSGIERLKNVSYNVQQSRNAQNRIVKESSASEGGRSVYSKLMEQVRQLNDRMDSMERRRAKRNRNDFYNGK